MYAPIYILGAYSLLFSSFGYAQTVILKCYHLYIRDMHSLLFCSFVYVQAVMLKCLHLYI